MPDWGTNPAKGLFFAPFEYIRDSPSSRQSGIVDSTLLTSRERYFSQQRRETRILWSSTGDVAPYGRKSTCFEPTFWKIILRSSKILCTLGPLFCALLRERAIFTVCKRFGNEGFTCAKKKNFEANTLSFRIPNWKSSRHFLSYNFKNTI